MSVGGGGQLRKAEPEKEEVTLRNHIYASQGKTGTLWAPEEMLP